MFEARDAIERLIKRIDQFSKFYKIGASGNPTEYSGALAIKSLRLKLEAMRGDYLSRGRAAMEMLKLLSGFLPDKFTPSSDNNINFSDKYLPFPKSDSNTSTSLSNAYSSYAESALIGVDAEKARFLPKVGAYAEAYAYDGSRTTATSYNTGLYLQMNLLNPSDIGAVKEAKTKADAARKKADEIRLKEESNFRVLLFQEDTLRKNILLSLDSLKTQEEQLDLSLRLFRTGTIHSLQLADVFGKTAEALISNVNLNSEYLKIRAELNMYNNLENYNE